MTIMNLQRRFRGTCGALLVGLVIAISTAGSAQQTTAPEGDYGYEGADSHRRNVKGATPGTSGPAATRSSGWRWHGSPRATSSLLNYIDSRRHGRRFRDARRDHAAGLRGRDGAGTVRAVDGPCDQPPVPGVPGDPTGIVGLRQVRNPKFDPGDAGTRQKYLQTARRRAAAVSRRHDLRLLPHRLQPAQPARRSGAAAGGRTWQGRSAISTGRKESCSAST